MALYRVRPGFVHGLRDEYRSGDTLELEPHQARSFADKLELVTVEPVTEQSTDTPEVIPDVTPAVFDVTGSTVAAVLAAVDRGVISAADTLLVETANRNRATLVKALSEMVNGPVSE